MVGRGNNVFQSGNPFTGESWLQKFCQVCTGKGYAMRVLSLDHNMFCEMGRSRLFILGIGEELGHSQGAAALVARIEERAACAAAPQITQLRA